MAPHRFTGGEFIFPSSQQDPLYYQRTEHRFAWLSVLPAIESKAPQVAKTLRRDVLPPFKAAGKIAPLPIIDPVFLRSLTSQPDGLPYRQLQECLNCWADKWHLKEPGFLKLALETLTSWHLNPRKYREEFWPFGPGEPTSFPHCRLVHFNAQAWHPQTEARHIANSRMVEELKKQVRRYLDYVEQEAKQLGMVKAPIKTNKAHFEWFALFQVCGNTFSDIAKGSGLDTDAATVKKAVDGVGRLLAGDNWKTWKRDTSMGGRPTAN